MTESAKKLLLIYYKQSRKIRRVSGQPPLTFKAKKAGTLKNYRIYGNTETKTRSYSGTAPLSFPIVDGGVSNYRVYGQTSRNLFDPSKSVSGYVGRNGNIESSDKTNSSDYIEINEDLTYTLMLIRTSAAVATNARVYAFYDIDRQFIAPTEVLLQNADTIMAQINIPQGAAYFRFSYDLSYGNIMLSVGSTALPYEPYGESVGDRTENLFNINSSNVQKGCYYDIYGAKQENSNYDCSDYIPCTSGVTYTLSFYSRKQYYGVFVNLWDSQKRFVSNLVDSGTITTQYSILNYAFTPNQNGYITFNFLYDTGYMDDIMLNIGSTALPYEPYGYRIPIINNSETANIYLDAPLTKSGDNVDYVDYAEQKRHNADGTSEDVSLPVLPAQSSSNSISVDTSVQPSSVAVDVSEVVSCGDKVTDSQDVKYGKYKIPVTLTAGSAVTTNIYLDEPLAKSGNTADYIDYAAQKRHNSDGTESSVTLPEITVTAGTSTLTVGTEVQPSNVYIMGKLKTM